MSAEQGRADGQVVTESPERPDVNTQQPGRVGRMGEGALREDLGEACLGDGPEVLKGGGGSHIRWALTLVGSCGRAKLS